MDYAKHNIGDIVARVEKPDESYIVSDIRRTRTTYFYTLVPWPPLVVPENKLTLVKRGLGPMEQLELAKKGLERVLDFEEGTPEGREMKEDIRKIMRSLGWLNDG